MIAKTCVVLALVATFAYAQQPGGQGGQRLPECDAATTPQVQQCVNPNGPPGQDDPCRQCKKNTHVIGMCMSRCTATQ